MNSKEFKKLQAQIDELKKANAIMSEHIAIQHKYIDSLFSSVKAISSFIMEHCKLINKQ